MERAFHPWSLVSGHEQISDGLPKQLEDVDDISQLHSFVFSLLLLFFSLSFDIAYPKWTARPVVAQHFSIHA